ncbi:MULTISPECIES: GNAT family N-acetyltransferase [unclassified Bacillus (in: firmicutes)]|uniref:GNAT family N-acetyltransferase n=1 Tax=unclassified Bacillus (in: firmicutes) TaxID=185979 RepID=UPI0008E372D8|nr:MULTISPECIES: GNAT family protein [unclassified Bacillus (in: firmicutes)]SFA79521.1 Protein N-acetyltransferase, RimJ/RimL family [Bacillus sp. UNCCL13]SFQ69545.1 Protein N-acetyltransferase, RimJ/RimL family [Bacillus sp. cl95]
METKSMLNGNRIYLDGLVKKDVSSFMKWQKKDSLMRNYDALPFTPKSETEWEKWIEDNGTNQFKFAIRNKENDDLLGHAAIDGILWSHRTAWVSIFIGEENLHGQGFGSEAMERVLEFAFCELNLHRLQLTVFSYNARAIALYEKLGFKKEGTYREFLERDLQRHDMFLYGLLKHEWRK